MSSIGGETNYVVTAHKPSSVTHSCVGNFTGTDQLNLIIAKCTRIEIHLFTAQGLQLMSDVPIYGRIAMLDLSRPHGENQDILFITTERYKFCVLQWDAEAAQVTTRAMGDVSGRVSHPTDNGQIAIIYPDCRSIGLHLYDGLFKVIPFRNKAPLEDGFNFRLEKLQVLDIKFLYGCPSPTIVVLYQDDKDACHVKTYEIGLEVGCFIQGPLSRENLDKSAKLLIPVPPPICGVLIIGEKTIGYCSASTFEAIPITPSITKAYGRVGADCSRYLLGDHNRLLHLLVINHEDKRVTGLKFEHLGKTSIASSISYLVNDTVFVGSSYGNSQLIKLNFEPVAEGSHVEVLETYVNMGPIVDFCVVDLERQGKCQVVTCSGAYEDGFLGIICNGFGIYEQQSVEYPGIKRMWPLRLATDGPSDTFLVVSFVSETRILGMSPQKELYETEMAGFSSDVQTIFCHDAVYNQFVQVTSNSVRLVSSDSVELRHEWVAEAGFSIRVATANATQVLLSAVSGQLIRLVYLEIGDGVLNEVKNTQMKYDISCLDINPIGDDPNHSQLAAVGTWTDICVMIFSLPDLDLIIKEDLGGNIISRSVLLCSFEGISYLLCALGDGCLLNFVLNTSNAELTDRKELSLGTQQITLHIFSSKDENRVFAASDMSAVIFSSNKKLHHSNVHVKDISYMCPFSPAALPDSFAFAKGGELAIGTIDDKNLCCKQLGEHARRICYQKQTQTFAICSVKYSQSSSEDHEMHFIHLLDDQNFEFMSTYQLNPFEQGCSILNCSFSGDSNEYFCVGTAYVDPKGYEPSKGRILVFAVEDRKLMLTAEMDTKGAVYSLNAFNGKLLAAINQKIQLYKWMRLCSGFHQLQFECGHDCLILPLHVQTTGDSIVVGDLMKSISLLFYEEGAIEERARDYNANWMSAVEILGDGIYLGAQNNFNLFTARKNSEVATYVERIRLEVVGEYHLGELVNRFRHGSLVMRPPDSDIAQIPTVIFGTVNGVLGVIASLPHEEYAFLEKLQMNMRKVVKGVGGLSHEQWRSFYDEKRRVDDAKNFLDGDLIESFPNLEQNLMDEISQSMSVPVEELVKRVEKLTRLH